MSIALFFVFLVALLYYIQAKYRLFLLGSTLAGPWALPLVGNVQMISKLKPEYLFLNFTENRAKYRQTYRLWLGPQLWVFLHSPTETRDALNDSTLLRPDTFKQLHVLIGNGLLISHGKHWETHRRALGPAFHPNTLNSFVPVISEHADKLVQKLKQTAEHPIEVTDYLFACILDMIIDTSMGKNINSQEDDSGLYTHAFHNTSELLFKRMVNPLLGLDFIFKHTNMYRSLSASLHIIHNLMETVIQERAAYLKETDNFKHTTGMRKKHLTLLDTLLTVEIDGRLLTFQEIRDEVNTFVFAGVDTTTAAMSFVLYALAKYPIEQSKLIKEVQSIPHGETGVSYIEAINKLVYLDMFIKECLRYYIIVPMTGRQTTTDTKIGHIKYCAGVTVWINMYGLAHDEELFEDPYVFRPERFSKERAVSIESFSYLPFSGGPHVCIGRKYALMMMKILTVKIVQNYEIDLTNPGEELVLMAQMVLKSLSGINLIFKQRNKEDDESNKNH